MDYWEEVFISLRKVTDELVDYCCFLVKIYDTFPDEFERFFPDLFNEIREAKKDVLKGEHEHDYNRS